MYELLTNIYVFFLRNYQINFKELLFNLKCSYYPVVR